MRSIKCGIYLGSVSGRIETEDNEIALNPDVMARVFQGRLIQVCAPFCIRPNEIAGLEMKWRSVSVRTAGLPCARRVQKMRRGCLF